MPLLSQLLGAKGIEHLASVAQGPAQAAPPAARAPRPDSATSCRAASGDDAACWSSRAGGRILSDAGSANYRTIGGHSTGNRSGDCVGCS